MSTPPQARSWKSTPFTIERSLGKTPGTFVFRFCGPFTARDMYSSLSPAAMSNVLDSSSTPSDEPPRRHILDLTAVPYMDSAGLGMIVGHYVSCQRKGLKIVAVGASTRVQELFKMTKVDNLFPMAATVDEADV